MQASDGEEKTESQARDGNSDRGGGEETSK